jgi:hypothetical protein
MLSWKDDQRYRRQVAQARSADGPSAAQERNGNRGSRRRSPALRAAGGLPACSRAGSFGRAPGRDRSGARREARIRVRSGGCQSVPGRGGGRRRRRYRRWKAPEGEGARGADRLAGPQALRFHEEEEPEGRCPLGGGVFDAVESPIEWSCLLRRGFGTPRGGRSGGSLRASVR